MTRTAPSSHGDSHDSSHHDDELMLADASAILDDDLDDETSEQGAEPVSANADDTHSSTHRTRSQVYSIRVPVERLEQVRALAKERNLQPTAMLREWVLARLDAETAPQGTEKSRAPDTPQSRSTRRLANPWPHDGNDEAVEALELLCAGIGFSGAAALLRRLLTVCDCYQSPQLPVTWRTYSSIHRRRISSEAAQGGFWSLLGGSPRELEYPAVRPHRNYYDRGIAEFHSTVEEVAGRPELREYDLGTLYDGADEELLNP